MTFPCGNQKGESRHNGKAKDQYLGSDAAATDTKPRTGVESATTTDISDSSESHGNEGQDVAALVAGRCTHGAKNNRVLQRCQLGLSRFNELAAT
jgi:surface antigen